MRRGRGNRISAFIAAAIHRRSADVLSPVPAAIEDAQAHHTVVFDHEGNGNAAVEADRAQTRAQIVVQRSTLGPELKPLAGLADLLFVTRRDGGGRDRSDCVVDPAEIVGRSGCVGKAPPLHEPFRIRAS